MPDFDAWLKGPASDFAGDASQDPGFIINRRAVSILIARGAADLPAQTVRIVPSHQGSPREGTGRGDSSMAATDVVVIGDSTFDVQRGDIFLYQGTRYEVIYVDKTMPDKIEAKAKARQ